VTGAEFSGVDIDLLADYIGGALEGTPDESVVAALIADDPAWRAAHESLGGGMALVQTQLADLGPAPMPSAVADRLDELFRPAPQLTLVHSDGQVRAPGRRRKWLTPIAVAAGLVFFVGFGLDYVAGREGANTDQAASGAATESGQDAAADPALSKIASGIDYSLGNLAVEPAQALAAPQAADPATSAAKSGSSRAALTDEPALARLTATDALQDCLDAIQQENAGGVLSVQSVDYARFNGSPALVVRFAAANGQWAWASGPDCGTPTGDAATLGKVPVR
jgi:hypothetical protein